MKAWKFWMGAELFLTDRLNPAVKLTKYVIQHPEESDLLSARTGGKDLKEEMDNALFVWSRVFVSGWIHLSLITVKYMNKVSR